MIDFVYNLHQVQKLDSGSPDQCPGQALPGMTNAQGLKKTKKRWSNDHLFSNPRFDCPFNLAEAREKKEDGAKPSSYNALGLEKEYYPFQDLKKKRARAGTRTEGVQLVRRESG